MIRMWVGGIWLVAILIGFMITGLFPNFIAGIFPVFILLWGYRDYKRNHRDIRKE